ncbi:MAG: GFA family protein [Candidatus Puniceispirillaceae bacterium]
MTKSRAEAGSEDRKGRCLCGASSYRFTAEPLRSTVCHCATCRRRTGSLFSAHLWFQPSQVTFSGDPLTAYVFATESGRSVSTYFCGACGSTLWFEADVTPGLMAICAGTLDHPNIWTRPGRELFCVNRPDFLSLDIAESHETQPF